VGEKGKGQDWQYPKGGVDDGGKNAKEKSNASARTNTEEIND